MNPVGWLIVSIEVYGPVIKPGFCLAGSKFREVIEQGTVLVGPVSAKCDGVECHVWCLLHGANQWQHRF